MYSQSDIDQINENYQWLKYLIDSNESTIESLHNIDSKNPYLEELIRNTNDAKKILARYTNLINRIKLSCFLR